MNSDIRLKKTTRTGKKIGMRNRALISIAVNDADRNVSRMWELLKSHYSRKHVTSAELARTVFLRGAVAVLEEMDLEARNAEFQEMESRQEKLF